MAMLSEFVDTLPAVFKRRFLLREQKPWSSAAVREMELTHSYIRYRVEGEGAGKRTIVFATDPPIVLEQYDELIALLKHDFRVVVLELPGFGYSFPKLNMSFKFEPFNQMLYEFLQKLDCGPYILAFPCITAFSAIWLANRYPELVSALVLMQAPTWQGAMAWKHGRDPQHILSTPIVGQVVLQLLKRKRAPAWLQLAVGNQQRLQGFIDTSVDALRNGACFSLASAFQDYLHGQPGFLTPVQQNTLIVWGEKDGSHEQTNKADSQALAVAPQCCHFAHAGHFPELEYPELFVAKLRRFLAAESSVADQPLVIPAPGATAG
jgi:pimeloyl-ACP methyl ester carboxylesterase